MNIFENNVVLEGRSAASLSVSGTAASTTDPLPVGTYAVWATVDTKIRVSIDKDVAEEVTTTNGFPITADNPVMPVRITRPAFLGAIAGSAGTLYYHQIA